MPHVYEGEPDARQSEDLNMKISRFRPRYRALSDEEKAIHDKIKGKATELEALFELTRPGRERSLALTELEMAVMWAVKALTS